MATACLNQNGNSAGPSCKFHVCAQLGYGTRYNFGYPMYRRYYVQVTKGQSSNFTSNLKVSWTSTTYALNVAGTYADTGWVSLGNKTCGTPVSLASVNCYYRGGSGTTYKSTSSAGSWTVPIATHTVAYNANGGSGAPASQTKTYGAVLTLSSTKPTRTGYTFKGWSTSSTATSATYSAGGQYGADQWGGTVTLYAVWKINAYTNSIAHWLWGFTNGEGTNPSGTAYQLSTTSFSANYNASVTVNTAKGITPPNGCYLSSSCGTPGLAGSWVNYTMPYTYNQPAKAITWEYNYHPTTYTITYNMNNGTNNSANPSSYNVLYGVTFANPTREYYNFKNWTNASGTVVTGINPGANATFTSASDLTTKLASRTVGNQTITANWTPWTHTVTYNGNATGVTNLPANQTKAYGSTITIPSGTSGTPVRAGYLFQGWATTPTGAVAYKPGATYGADQNGGTVTLYAVWLVATKITMTLSDVTSGYNITNTSAGKAVLSALNIPFTLGTVTENASLKFYYHPYYIDKDGTKKYFSTDPIGGQTPTAMGNKGTLTLSGDNVKAYILATENYDYITIGVDTYTAEITEDTKGSAGPYNYAVYINNYTPVYVDVLNVYRPTDSSIVVKVEIEFPSCYSGIASTTYPQLYFNSSAITTAPTSASVNGTIGTYIYNLTGLSGAGTFEASFDDGLTAMTSVRKIAASTANQRFSVEEDTVYALEFIEVGKEGI